MERPRVRLLGAYEYLLYYILENNQQIKYRINRKQIYKSRSYVYIMQTVAKYLSSEYYEMLEKGWGRAADIWTFSSSR